MTPELPTPEFLPTCPCEHPDDYAPDHPSMRPVHAPSGLLAWQCPVCFHVVPAPVIALVLDAVGRVATPAADAPAREPTAIAVARALGVSPPTARRRLRLLATLGFLRPAVTNYRGRVATRTVYHPVRP
jgi:hypothetical protein